MHSLSPSTQLALEWSASSPFLAEVYDEQQLLQQRDLIYRRREEMRKEREKLKQQQHLLSESMRDRFPNLIQDTNPLIPKPVVDEYDHRHPAASHDNSRKRTASGSESSYIPEDTVFSDRQGSGSRNPCQQFRVLHAGAAESAEGIRAGPQSRSHPSPLLLPCSPMTTSNNPIRHPHDSVNLIPPDEEPDEEKGKCGLRCHSFFR